MPLHRCLAWSSLLSMAVITGCGPIYSEPEVVDVETPKISYSYNSDQELIEANSKARAFCAGYAATSLQQGSITEDAGGTKTVTFECVQSGTALPPALSHPLSIRYRTDIELLQAVQSADAYCARNGQIASTSIVTGTDGTKQLAYRCVPH